MATEQVPKAEKERIAREFKENLTKLTTDTIQEYYTAQYKVAILGLIQSSGKTPDELQDEVLNWLHYDVDNFTNPVREVPRSSTPLLCIYGIDKMPCEDCEHGDKNNSLSPCNGCHHAKACMFKQKEEVPP